MPSKKDELETIKKQLLEIRAKLVGQIEEVKKEVKESEKSKGYSQHQADEGTDDFDMIVNLELSNRELGIVNQIDRALQKIEEGTYGICDVSGEKIAKARLEAIPYACMTVQAQEEMEKKATSES